MTKQQIAFESLAAGEIPASGESFFSSSLKAMNHKNVTNLV